MGLLATQRVTLQDVLSRMDPNGKLADIAEYLTAMTPVVQDVSWIEGNLPTGNKTVIRTSEPTVFYRELNKGVQRSKSTTAAVDDGAAMLEAYQEIDREVAILSGDVGGYRMSEAPAFISAMGKAFSAGWWYGNAALDDKTFTGLTPRYNSLSGTTADQIVSAGGSSGDLRSIWFVVHGAQTIRGIYPKGTKGGLFHDDVTANRATAQDGFPIGDKLLDSDGNIYMGYTDRYSWRCGASIKDWRYASRIPNISLAAIVKTSATGPDLEDLLIQAEERLQDTTMGVPKIYMCRELRTWMRRQAVNRKSPYLTLEEFGGRKAVAFNGIEIMRDDTLNVNETQVS